MASHPYHPSEAILPNYQPNALKPGTLMALFATISASIILLTHHAVSRQLQPSPRLLDRIAAPWFALSFIYQGAFLHICFEGYFIYFKDSLLSQQTLFAMLWKEYALSDSRYLTGDIFTLCVEAITVLAWGPLCLLTVLAIIVQSPSRHFLQVVVCVAHLYGVVLYYSTNWADYRATGVSHSRPEFLYYWVYYVGFNMPWLLIPIGLLYDSWSQITGAITFQRDAEQATKGE